MWVCVVAIFSVIGFTWFRSTAHQFAVLVNPDLAKQEEAVAEEETSSPFATIGNSVKGWLANVGELFDFTNKTNDILINNSQEVKPNLLPLSKDR